MRLLAAASLLLVAALAAGCASGRPSGATLGMSGRTLLDRKTGEPAGVMVMRLHDRSPLKAEGVREGDVVVSVDGEPVGRASELVKRVFAWGFEKPLALGIRTGDEEREVSVVPAPAYRQFRIGLGFPFLWDTDGDEVEVLDLCLFKVGCGPDERGFLLLGCIGFMSRPDSNDVWLAIFHTGTGVGPPTKVKKVRKDPDEDLLTLPSGT